MAVTPGSLLGRYHILSPLGEGGMGEVYLAKDTQLGRQVAIKFPTVKSDEHHTHARFLREARSVSALSHRNIATIYDYGETKDGQPYLVMELIKGESLSDLMHSSALTLSRSVEIIADVAEALAEAHKHGIIHRDIKPSNVMINERGEVKVLDFGLAKQLHEESVSTVNQDADTLLATTTKSGMVVGTPLYLSPEQATSAPVDARSDIFALGSLLYECITGRSAFSGKGVIAITAQIIHVDPPLPSTINAHVPDELDRITLKALAKAPESRYQSAEEMLADLRELCSILDEAAAHHTQRVIKAPKTLQTSAFITISEGLRRPRLSLAFFVLAIAAIIAAIIIYNSVTRTKLHQPSVQAQKLFDKGVEALREGAYYQASIKFEQAVAADNKFALAHARLAEALVELDSIDRATNELLVVSQLVPDRSALSEKDRLYLDAVIATVSRDFPQAVKSYEGLSALAPDQPQAFVDLGRAYENNQEIAKAIESYVKVTNLDSAYATAYLRVGILFGRQGQLPSADAAFGKAEQLYQGNVEGRTEVLFQRGALSLSLGKHADATSMLKQALEMSRVSNNQAQQIKVLLQLALALQNGGDTAQAQLCVGEALKLAQSNGMQNLVMRGLVDLGSLYLVKGSYPEADKYFKQALELAQSKNARRNEARASLSLASLRIQQGLADEAIQYIQQALPFYQQGNYRNETAQALLLLGRANNMKGDYDAALKAFQQQLQIAEEADNSLRESIAHEGIGNVLFMQERFTEAIEHFQQAYVIDKNDKRTGEVGIDLINKANVSWQLGNHNEAQASFAEVSSIVEQSGDEYKFLQSILDQASAEMALTERRFPEAKLKTSRLLLTGKDLTDPDKIEVKRILGLAQLLSGEKQAGKLSCEAAFEMASHQSDPWLLSKTLLALAEAQLETGDAQGALKSALKAQEIFSRAGQQASEWRAMLIAARASRNVRDVTATQHYASLANSTLSNLEQKYGAEAYKSYLGRADVQYYRKQLGELLAGNN